jgi:hypothetical protein
VRRSPLAVAVGAREDAGGGEGAMHTAGEGDIPG